MTIEDDSTKKSKGRSFIELLASEIEYVLDDQLPDCHRHVPDEYLEVFRGFLHKLAAQEMCCCDSPDYDPISSFAVPLMELQSKLWALESEKQAKKYREYSAGQKVKSSKATVARWAERGAVNDIITAISKRRDELGDLESAKSLWSEFYSLLDDKGLRPKESDGQIRWIENAKGMSFKTFSTRISAERNLKK